MEAKANSSCSTPADGSLVYQDDYGIIYRVSWETSRSGFDITTITQDPRVPGEEASGYKDGHALIRRGLITIERQILVDTDDGYTIVSSGVSQTIGHFQASFPCGPKFVDRFCYHLNNAVSDEFDAIVTCGPRWTDPDVDDDDVVTWGSVGAVDGVVGAETIQLFQWVDVWGQDDSLSSTCP